MTGPDRTPRARPSFAHASEAELARILDFYDVRWAYEPDTFPIGWSLDGDAVESFSPDFYLPDLELYVELTTLKQKLVRKKNRKLRRLRELYPDVRIKLFYARDFRMLLLKFGRLALSEELTGTTGQATPPRIPVEAGLPDAARSSAAVPAADELPVPASDADAVPATPGANAAPAAASLAARPPDGPPAAVPAAGDLPAAGAEPAVLVASPPARAEARGRRRGRRRRRPAGDPAAGQTAGAPLDPGSP